VQPDFLRCAVEVRVNLPKAKAVLVVACYFRLLASMGRVK